jgi:hypothetical protein
MRPKQKSRNPVNNNGGAHGVGYKIPKHTKSVKDLKHGLSGRSAPGVCGPEGDGVGAPKRGRGRPKITGKRPWEIAGMARRTWYRRQAEKKEKQK